MRRRLRTARLGMPALLCALLLSSTSAAAQTGPPIHGVTGTIATETTIKSEHDAANKVAEGAGKVVDGAKKLLPGGKGTNQNPLDGFTEGRSVVLRDVAAADREVAEATEGVVIDVNRRRNQITVRLADRKTQTLRLATPDATADVVVSYTDPVGAKVARDFKRVS
jgi:X-X-X-Leu-X-X-Gly heptad repeat protein